MILSPEQVLSVPAIDDVNAVATGTWYSSQALPGYIGRGYVTDGNELKGQKSLRFATTLPSSGTYELFFYYTPSANRAWWVSRRTWRTRFSTRSATTRRNIASCRRSFTGSRTASTPR